MVVSAFYARFYWQSLTTEDGATPLTLRVTWMQVWGTGAAFIGVATAFVVPLRLGLLSVAVACVWLVLWFPIAFALRRLAARRK